MNSSKRTLCIYGEIHLTRSLHDNGVLSKPDITERLLKVYLVEYRKQLTMAMYLK